MKPPWILRRMRNVSDKSCREIQKHFYLQRPFSENRVVYEIMWTNIADSGKLHTATTTSSAYSLQVHRVILAPDHTPRHTHTRPSTRAPSKTPLEEGSARRRDLYLKTQKTHKRQTTMSPDLLKTAIPASERLQTYASDTLDYWGYKYTLRICNIYCFTTVTTVTRTRLSVTYTAWLVNSPPLPIFVYKQCWVYFRCRWQIKVEGEFVPVHLM
jgi:hypothetical protein